MEKVKISEVVASLSELIESDLPRPEEEVHLKAALGPLWAIYDRMEEE
ncbi:hypothetical protein [Streptomyces sp. NPDC002644]